MIKGSCLCGAIAYEVDMPEEKALEGTGCYCESCRKTSSASSFQIQGEADKIKVTKGSPKVYEDVGNSGKPVHRNFCGDCGTPLWSNTDSMPNTSFIKVGALDIGKKVKLTTEIFSENAHPSTLRSNATHLDANMKPLKA